MNFFSTFEKDLTQGTRIFCVLKIFQPFEIFAPFGTPYRATPIFKDCNCRAPPIFETFYGPAIPLSNKYLRVDFGVFVTVLPANDLGNRL